MVFHNNVNDDQISVEDTSVSSLLLSNSSKIVNSLNATNIDLPSSKENESTSKLEIIEGDTNGSDICTNKCSCEICKEASIDNPSSTLKNRPNDKLELKGLVKSSSKPSIPTFGAYN